MDIPLRRYADDHVRTVVAMATGLPLPALLQADVGRRDTGRPDAAGRPRFPPDLAAPERRERIS
ncbi:hypothetical protein [Streptomyces sp. NPDC005760]|uniref:hypothetical protein n=1 Tax=Streptomyces sp. NPDC005760 TaxID=3156718 RepID=UPI0033CEA0BD